MFDVAKYIAEKIGVTSPWKLHKLLYYSQAWSLVWSESELFKEEILAWVNGPVIEELYQKHKGKFKISECDIPGDSLKLNTSQKEIIDQIVNTYGQKASQWLKDLIQMESPWQNAREDIPSSERGNKVITKISLKEYYGSLGKEDEKA